jgi:hypothetical protein
MARIDTRAFILASGKATRFKTTPNYKYKQLMSIWHSETILARIVRQCRLRGINPYIVTPYKMIANRHDNILYPKNCDTTSDTFLSTRRLWSDRTVILLGDVVYSKAIMDGIFKSEKDIAVFGNCWEIFAIVFMRSVWDSVVEALEKSRKHGLGKVRYFYKAYIGVDMDHPDEPGQVLEPVIFQYNYDWTRDIDTYEEYVNMIREVVNTHILDDLEPA